MDATRVITFRLVTTSFTTSCSSPEYRSSVFSRKITMPIFTSENRDATPGSDRTGLTLAYKSSRFRSATLTLANPPPIGVVTGPFNPTRVRSRLSRTSCGSETPVLRINSSLSWTTSQSMETPVASTARRAAEETSGPIPSPGINVTWWDTRPLYIQTMADTVVEALILDLLAWVAMRERTYEDVMNAWRTSCPRLPVWEDANDRGLVQSDGRVVRVTPAGAALLNERRRPMH